MLKLPEIQNRPVVHLSNLRAVVQSVPMAFELARSLATERPWAHTACSRTRSRKHRQELAPIAFPRQEGVKEKQMRNALRQQQCEVYMF